MCWERKHRPARRQGSAPDAMPRSVAALPSPAVTALHPPPRLAPTACRNPAPPANHTPLPAPTAPSCASAQPLRSCRPHQPRQRPSQCLSEPVPRPAAGGQTRCQAEPGPRARCPQRAAVGQWATGVLRPIRGGPGGRPAQLRLAPGEQSTACASRRSAGRRPRTASGPRYRLPLISRSHIQALRRPLVHLLFSPRSKLTVLRQ